MGSGCQRSRWQVRAGGTSRGALSRTTRAWNLPEARSRNEVPDQGRPRRSAGRFLGSHPLRTLSGTLGPIIAGGAESATLHSAIITRYELRRLRPDDAEASVALRAEMLEDTPQAFLGMPGDDDGLDPDVVRHRLDPESDSASFGAFSHGGRLVGSVGFFRLAREKQRHKGMIVGVYVTPSARRVGLARALLGMAIDHARAVDGLDMLQLAVSAATPGARALYESVGFVAWGTEPRAVRVDGVDHAEIHMDLDLTAG